MIGGVGGGIGGGIQGAINAFNMPPGGSVGTLALNSAEGGVGSGLVSGLICAHRPPHWCRRSALSNGGGSILSWTPSGQAILIPSASGALNGTLNPAFPYLINGAIGAGSGIYFSQGQGGGSGQQPTMTQWGWTGSNSWNQAVKTVGTGNEDGVIYDIAGKVPTQQEGEQLIQESGGNIVRIEPAHPEGGVSPINFPAP